MKQTQPIILILFLFLGMVFGIQNCKDKKHAFENLSGTYTDLEPYPYGKAFGKRTFTKIKNS